MSELHGPGPVVSGSGIGRVFPPRSGQLPIGGPGPVVSGSGIGGKRIQIFMTPLSCHLV
ncbi:unnamed protein product [Anisakis simplex]|uniref:Uncharacterized protein n=1 Tax=Anisakis simplex TaxID=6269 RepID=A0A0M3J7T9_ANISI|nr:unnamed protein product [Anisakis simplex]